MGKPYRPVHGHVKERLTIAALCGETLDLYWEDETGDQAYLGKVVINDVVEADGRDYLLGRDDQGQPVRIRLDLIRNLPTPVK